MIKNASETVGSYRELDVTNHHHTDDGFLAWLLDRACAQQNVGADTPPAGDPDVTVLALSVRQCVATACLDPLAVSSVLDVIEHVATHTGVAGLRGKVRAIFNRAVLEHGISKGAGEGVLHASRIDWTMVPGFTGVTDFHQCSHGKLCPSCATVTSAPEFVARARAVGIAEPSNAESWPYGPNVNHQARIELVEWAEREGLVWAPGQDCLRWLAKGRCSGACSTAYGPRRWRDHVSCWTRDGKAAVLVSQPYGLSNMARAQMDSEARERGLEVAVLPTGWYGHGTTFIQFTRRGA